MNHLILGLGEIGTAIYGIFPDAQTLDIEKKAVELPVEVMHVCFPHSVHFEAEVKQYRERFKPDHVIVYSTVPIGTCERLGVVHSPIEGRHPDLELSVRQMTRWLGGRDTDELMFFKNVFWDKGIHTRLVGNPAYTEALKLLSTAEYGVNLVFADYKARVASEIDMDYGLTKEWNQDYNKLYKELGADKRFQKFVLDPPGGVIGGHCVVPNAKLLDEDYPDELLELIIDMEAE